MNLRSTAGVRLLALASAVALCGPATHAQQGRGEGAGRGVLRVPEEAGSAALRLALESDTVKGAPYSAEVINESTQTLSDGNRIVRRTTSRVYRDSEGRVRREEDRPPDPPAVSVTDPVAGTSWSFDSERRVVRQSPGTLGFRFFDGGQQLQQLTVLLNGQATAWRSGPGGGFIISNGTREQRTGDKLPGRTIEGVWAEGVRRTTTIAAGAIGNERPIVVVSEEWTSPDLKMLVLSESSDPRVGKTTYKVTNIVRGDPDPSLFQIPAGYTVEAGGGRGARSGAPPR